MLHESNIALEAGQARVYFEESVFTKLVSIGISDKLRFDAYHFLSVDASLVRVFLVVHLVFEKID